MHLSIFISPWHDQASIFGHRQDVFCELWQFYCVFSYSLSFDTRRNVVLYNQEIYDYKSFDRNINNPTPTSTYLPTYLLTYLPTLPLTHLPTHPQCTHDPPTYLPTFYFL
jgi:hypothetical protein